MTAPQRAAVLLLLRTKMMGWDAVKCDTWLRAVRVLETQHRWERPGKPSRIPADAITLLDTADEDIAHLEVQVGFDVSTLKTQHTWCHTLQASPTWTQHTQTSNTSCTAVALLEAVSCSEPAMPVGMLCLHWQWNSRCASRDRWDVVLVRVSSAGTTLGIAGDRAVLVGGPRCQVTAEFWQGST